VGRWWLYEPDLGALAWQSYEEHELDPTLWSLDLVLSQEHFVATVPFSRPPRPVSPLAPPVRDALPPTPVVYRTAAGALRLEEARVASMVGAVCAGLGEEPFYLYRAGDTLVFGVCTSASEATLLVFRGALSAVLYPEDEA